MKRSIAGWAAAAGLCGMLAVRGLAAGAGPAASTNAGEETDAQIEVSCQILEMPVATARTFFGKPGEVSGREVTDALLKRIKEDKSVDLLSAPRVTTRAGQSAQIRIGQEHNFTTNFKVVATNGVWEPVLSNMEFGISMTVVVSPFPNNPDQLRGTAEVLLSELVSVKEQKVTPPGQKESFTLQMPAVSSRSLASTFVVKSGQTVVMGGLEQGGGDKAKTTIILLRMDSVSPAAELIGKLKGWIVEKMDLREAALPDVAEFLAAQSRQLDPEKKGVNIILRLARPDVNTPPPVITLTLRGVSLYDALRYVSEISGTSVKYDRNTVILSPP